MVMVIIIEHQCVWLKWHGQRMRLPTPGGTISHSIQCSPAWAGPLAPSPGSAHKPTEEAECRGELAQQQLIGERPNLTLPQRHIYGIIH